MGKCGGASTNTVFMLIDYVFLVVFRDNIAMVLVLSVRTNVANISRNDTATEQVLLTSLDPIVRC